MKMLSIVEQIKWFLDEWERPDNQTIIESLDWKSLMEEDETLKKINEFINALEEAIETKKKDIKRSDDKVLLFNSKHSCNQ